MPSNAPVNAAAHGPGSSKHLPSRAAQRLLISTLRSYGEGTGGRLHLVAEFPGRKPIELAGFVAVENSAGKKKNWPSMRVLTKVSERPRVTVLK